MAQLLTDLELTCYAGCAVMTAWFFLIMGRELLSHRKTEKIRTTEECRKEGLPPRTP